MRILFSFAFLWATISSFALETKPWFGDVYAFEFQSIFSYSRFHKVQGASRQLSAPLNNRDLVLDLGFTPCAAFDFQVEGEFGKTNTINWNLRSGAVQARYQMLDDISGDPVSLVFGGILRGATHHFLKDVSTPYAAEFNIELTCSVGKEWSEQGVWMMRTYGFVALGQANQGYPWARGAYLWQYNLDDTHRFTLFADADCGFGNKQHVNVRHFSGWGRFQHQSIDLGLSYGYKIGLYGVITASYAHRVYAHNFPEHVNFFALAYTLPFSLL
jgi:hypothetical protein